MPKKKRKKSWEIFQKHHLEYIPEKIVKITRTEHFFCGRMEAYFKARGMTPGMAKALRYMAKKYAKT